MLTETISNVNVGLTQNYGNTGLVTTNIEPGIPKAVVLVPKQTIIPAAEMVSQSTFLNYLNTASAQGLIADSRANRWFALIDLDTFEDKTKAPANVDTGLYQFDHTKFNTKFSFRYMANKANHQELLNFQNTNAYDCYIIDAAGNVWGRMDSTGSGGLMSYYIKQLFIMDFKPATVKDLNVYDLSIQFGNRLQFNEQFAIYQAGIDPDSLVGLENAVLTDVSSTLGTPLSITTTTDVVLVIKTGVGSEDVVSVYGSSLTASCFVATDLTSGTVLTAPAIHGTGTIIVSNQTYNYVWLRHGTAPTATHKVQYTLAAPSVVNAIIPNFNMVSEIVQSGVNGANAAVHTF